MGNPDQVGYGLRARLRAAVSSLAAGIADSAQGLVPTYADSFADGGELVQSAARIAADARHLLQLAAAYERRRGTSWEVIGEALGVSRQGAHDRFGEDAKRFDAEIIRCWLLGDDPRYPLPYGAADTAGAADILDRWVTRRLQGTDPLAHRPEDDPERLRPVSHNLPAMDALEHSALIAAASAMLCERRGAVPDDPEAYAGETRALEVGFVRRKIELYDRQLAEGLPAADVDQVRDLLAAAGIRLAELEQAGLTREGLTDGTHDHR